MRVLRASTKASTRNGLPTRRVLPAMGETSASRSALHRKARKLRPASWTDALQVVAERLNRTAPEKIAAIIGDLAAAEEIKALKDLIARLRRCQSRLPPGRRQDRRRAAPGLSFQHGFRRHRSSGRDSADRHQSALGSTGVECAHPESLDRRNVRIANVGEAYDLTYPCSQLGASPRVLQEIATARMRSPKC